MAYPTISCFPPLAELSFIPHDEKEVPFTVFIEWDSSRPLYPFEVVLCYSDSYAQKHPSQWKTFPLEKSGSNPIPVRPKKVGSFRATYTGVLPITTLASASDTSSCKHILFTIKHRVNVYAPWCWEQIQTGARHGELIWSRKLDQGLGLSSILKLEAGWEAEPIAVDGQSNKLFSIHTSGSIPRSSSDDAKMEDSVLGRIQDQLRFLAIVRLEPYWLGPRHGTNRFYIGEDAIVISFLTEDGAVLTFLAFNGSDDVYTVFRSGVEGEIVVSSRNDGNGDVPFRVLAAIGTSFEDSMAVVMEEARRLVHQTPKIQEFAKRSSQHNKQDSIDDWADGLTYCTWNGLGQDLTTEKLLGGLQKLTENGIKVPTLLIDDNWQTLGKTDYDYSDPFFRGWAEFQANKDISPNGMKGLIARLRQDHPYLEDIGVWHALFGYWGGLAKDGKLAKEYKTIQVEAKLMGNTPANIYVTDASDIHKLYDDFYAFLSESGLDIVKTDVQHMPGELVNTKDRRALPSAYSSAWTSAYLRHFNGKVISCMSSIPENLFHSLLQTTTPRIILRNSDDFYPEVAASHPWHIWVNAHNSLFTQHLNVLPDWDMFQTKHSSSRFHAAARCVSGGPILITDVPGEHDLDLLDEMVAPSPSGRSIALRPGVAKTTSVWESYTDGNILKVGSSTGDKGNETGILGLFNVSEKENNFLLSVEEFPGVSSKEVVIRSHVTGKIFGPVVRGGLVAPEALLQESLPSGAWDIVTAHPVHEITSGVSIAIIGLLGKMTGAAAVTSCVIDGAQVKLVLKAVGVLVLWFSQFKDIKVSVQGKQLAAQYLKIMDIAERAKLCEIDILAVWKESNGFSQGHKVVDIEIDLA